MPCDIGGDLEHDPEKWGTGFRKDLLKRKIERMEDSKKSHPAIASANAGPLPV